MTGLVVNFTFANAGPHTIWGALAARLGREPTGTEVQDECVRILHEVRADLAEAGKLPHQRGRP